MIDVRDRQTPLSVVSSAAALLHARLLARPIPRYLLAGRVLPGKMMLSLSNAAKFTFVQLGSWNSSDQHSTT